ncbi:hypothetical protein [Nocardia transvalensis]|uniref:hypothetical protein n=1 Tax=Nocardia transvalensis TaxID=37333 RepID=UPI00189512FF|nr:hypothetical protein [Nocardia transvalensis]MBF6328030.1 hypothetical protein [Nocardia transvalensis]
MALIEIDELPAQTAEVLRRRARAARLPTEAYVRRQLIELAGRRVAIDAVVEFLETERPNYPGAEIDADAMALIHTYDLPADAWSVFGRRAAAAGVPIGEYVRRELVAMARRSTIDEAMLEFREAQERDPSLNIDMDALRASLRYVRGE